MNKKRATSLLEWAQLNDGAKRRELESDRKLLMSVNKKQAQENLATVEATEREALRKIAQQEVRISSEALASQQIALIQTEERLLKEQRQQEHQRELQSLAKARRARENVEQEILAEHRARQLELQELESKAEQAREELVREKLAEQRMRELTTLNLSDKKQHIPAGNEDFDFLQPDERGYGVLQREASPHDLDQEELRSQCSEDEEYQEDSDASKESDEDAEEDDMVSNDESDEDDDDLELIDDEF